MRNKIILVPLLGILMVSFASAWSFDNVKDTTTITFDGKDVKDYPLLQTYTPIKISNAFDLPLIGDTILEGYLSQHTETCGEDCSSTMEIKLYEERPLIDEVEFKTLQLDGRWIKQDVRSYQFEYLGRIEDYETQCITGEEKIYPNGTKYVSQDCFKVLTGSHEGWINYELGTKMPEGTYTVKLEAKKKPSRTLDWIIKTGGETLTEWATWGNISLGDDAEVILNSPVNGAIAYTFLQTFNASANITGGINLTTISLWTNESGVWEEKNSSMSTKVIYSNSTESSSSCPGQDCAIHSIFNPTEALVEKVNFDLKHTSVGGAYGVVNITYVNTTINKSFYYQIPSEYISLEFYNPHPSEPVDKVVIAMGGSGGGATAWIKNVEIYGFNVSTSDFGIWNRTITEDIIWNVQACDLDGDCGFATSNYTLSIDRSAPVIEIESPLGILNYGVIGQPETLNVTFTDTNLETCWYNYNGTNITIDGCISGIKNSTTFILEEGNYNMTIWANDSIGNENSTFINWSYKAIQQNITFNSETFETAEEIFILELIIPEENLTNAKLIYNEIEYPATIIDKGDNEYNITSTIQIPVTVGNMSFYFNFDIDGDTLNSTINYQFIKGWLFNFDESHQVINVTIRDEEDDSIINSTELYISSNYYIDDGTIYKTFLNTSTEDGIFNIGINNSNVESFFADSLFRYESTGYKSRDYNALLTLSNSSISDINLYLLLTANGVTQYFKTYVSTTYAIAPEVSISAYRIEGITEYFADSIITDDNGEGFLFLDDDEEYKLYISKEGCVSFTKVISPTGITVQDIEIDCGAEEGVVYDNESLIIYEDLSVIFSPQNPQIQTGVKEFEVDIDDDSCTITSIDYYLKKNGVTINSTSSSNACGEDLTLLYNVTENGTMQSYVVIVRNETELIYQKTYYILDTSGLIVEGETLWDMLDKLEDITDLGMSQNTKVFLSFIILFLILGFLSMSGIGRSEGIGMFIVIWAYILIMSSIGWLEVNFTSFEYLNKFAILLVVTTIGATIMLIKTEN